MKKRLSSSITQTAQDKKGFTLVEVMIAAAISVTIILGLSTLIINSVKHDRDAKLKQDQYMWDQQRKYEIKTVPPPPPGQ